MEYALLGLLYIFRELFNTLTGLVVDEEGGITIGTVLIAIIIIRTFFWFIGLVGDKVSRPVDDKGEDS